MEEIAKEKRSSVGELVRTAVKKTYRDETKPMKTLTLAEALKDTFGTWVDPPPSDKELTTSLYDRWAEPDKIF